MKKVKKSIALLLTLLCLFDTLPVNAAYQAPFTYREVYTGGVQTTYLTVKENIPVRTEPIADPTNIITRLPANSLIVGDGKVVNSKGNTFITLNYNNNTCYIFSENLKIHDYHNYTSIPDYTDFSFCIDCGKVVFASPESTVVDATETVDYIHAALLVCSFLGGIGNFCDFGDALLSLAEGDMESAAWGFFAAIPLLGNLRYLDTADNIVDTVKIYETADQVIYAQTHGGSIEIFEEANSSILRKNLDEAFELTGNSIYKKPGEIVQAHHIVCGSDPACTDARAILHYVDIPINSVDNGLYLCGKTEICDDIGRHVGSHTSSYYSQVNEIVKKSFNEAGPAIEQKREAVRDALSRIAEQLKSGDIKLNNYTPR